MTTNCTGSLQVPAPLALSYATSTEHRFIAAAETTGRRMKCTACDAGRFLRADGTIPTHRPVHRATVVIPA